MPYQQNALTNLELSFLSNHDHHLYLTTNAQIGYNNILSGQRQDCTWREILLEAELEIGQLASYVHSIKPAAQILNKIWQEFILEKQRIS